MSTPAAPTLTDLLGDTRGAVLRLIQQRARTAGAIAEQLDISAAAVRRHLTAMEADDLVTSTSVRDGGMGRPADHWSLTDRGKRLFADRSSEFADELLDHIEATYGRAAVADFLKSRNARKADELADRLAEVDDPRTRAHLLAQALSDDGFAARVEHGDNGRSLTLLQSHCAIEGIAREHPEICAHEAALFKQVLDAGTAGVKVSRRETIASGAPACVCHIQVPDHQDSSPQTSDRSE